MVTNVHQKPSPPRGGSRNFYWGGPTFGSERTVELFLAYYFSQRRSRVSQSVNAGRRWSGTALRAEANRSKGGSRKTITFGI